MKPAPVNLLVFVATLALCLAHQQADAATVFLNPMDPGPILADLIAGRGTPAGQVVAGDKRFSNFQYVDKSTDPGDMPTAGGVRIIPVQDSITGNFGIRIAGGFGDSQGTVDPSSAEISFDVDVIDPTYRIIGVELSGDPTVMGNDNEGTVAVAESFEPKSGPLGNLRLDIFDDATSGDRQSFDSLTFATPQTSLRVLKDIRANSGNGPVAMVTSIDQFFAQTVIPEPSSYMLMSIMGLAMMGSRYRFG